MTIDTQFTSASASPRDQTTSAGHASWSDRGVSVQDGVRGGDHQMGVRSASEAVSTPPIDHALAAAPAAPTQLLQPEQHKVQAQQLPWPPGFAGQLARHIYEASYYPVPEVSIAAALGFLAGVCGRAYRTHTGKDLALYIVLVARSGSGKDGIHDGIQKLIEISAIAGAEKFIRIANFASGPALHKALLLQPGFLYLQGEFGRKLKGMATPSNAPMQELRTVMTDAYAKRFLEAKTYSGSENSLPGVAWPALSFLGETTPGTFLESLTPDMMEDGFMSRFLVISFEGDRPNPNESFDVELDSESIEKLRFLLKHTVLYQQIINTPKPIVVTFKDASAREKLKTFELECNANINASQDEAVRQTFNRAHLKVLKVASLLAVADNHFEPKIDLGHATWAKRLVLKDIENFETRRRSGDIGNSDHTRQSKLMALIKEYVHKSPAPSHSIPAGMREVGVIPRNYLQHCISSSKAFTTGLGCVANLNAALRNMEDDGLIATVQKIEAVSTWGFHGKCYRLISKKLVS